MSNSFATLLAGGMALVAGLITTFVVWWQAHLLKKQIALSTFLELDKEWNSESMWERRREVRRADDSWNESVLEGVLEFVEKFAMLTRTKALKKKDVYNSTLMFT